MSREHIVKLNEEEILRINYWFVAKEAYQGLDLEDEPLANKLTKAKDKKYTNLDKVKDEMTIDDFMYVVMYSPNYEPKMWCKKGLNDCRKCKEDSYKCMKEWLESEVKDNG